MWRIKLDTEEMGSSTERMSAGERKRKRVGKFSSVFFGGPTARENFLLISLLVFAGEKQNLNWMILYREVGREVERHRERQRDREREQINIYVKLIVHIEENFSIFHFD